MKDGYYWYTENPDEAGDHVERHLVKIEDDYVFYHGSGDDDDDVSYCLLRGEFKLIDEL